MKKAAILLAVVGIVVLSTQAAFADRGGTPNRDPVPACANSNGRAPSQNPHCYPPQQGSTQGAQKSNFQFPSEASRGSVTVGMLIIAGLGAFTVFLAARGVRRRIIG
jgi:hypothetical protein